MSHPGEDRDKTFIVSAATQAPRDEPGDVLPMGTRLGEFELLALIGIGGFGIVYLALDHSLGRRVALKEYMPQTLARRGSGLQVSVRSVRHEETFEAGRRSFVNEARLLARFDHPALVKVYRFWEANGTAYMVMPYYEGTTLKEVLKARPDAPDEAWLRRLLAPLLDALEVIHAEQVFHRDVAPDNILLLGAQQEPLLLDFGAARHVIGDLTQAPTVILKPGYAPIEQYAEVPGLRQGAWTDLYALAAVVFLAITRHPPPPSVGRLIDDPLVPLARQAAGRYGAAFLQAIDRALAVKPQDRPQDVAAMRALLGLPPARAAARASSPAQPSSAPPRPPRPRGAGMAAGAAAALASAVLAAWLLWPSPSGPPAERQEPPMKASNEPAAPFSPLAEIDRIFEQRSRAHSVSVTLPQSRVTIGVDRLTFNLRSNHPGYVYVLMVGTDRQHFYVLFPNQVDADNRIAAGQDLALPRQGWSMVAGGPAGVNQFVAVVSDSPRDMAGAGLVAVDPFAEFPLEAAARAAAAVPAGGASPFLGAPVCREPGAGCSAAYGAAVFTIEEVDAAAR